MRRILLTGARAPVTLDLARHFHRAQNQVFLADSIHWPIARLTRCANRTFHVPRPIEDPEKFARSILQIAIDQKIDLVIPTCEEIFYLSAFKPLFEGVTELFSLDLPDLRRLHDKWQFAMQTKEWNLIIKSPESHLIPDKESIAAWKQRPDLDEWVFKPVFSRFASRTIIGASAQALETVIPTGDAPWIAQRRVRGQELSTYSIVRKGSVTAHACYKSKYRAGPGSGIYFIPVDNEVIRNFVREFAQRTNYTGQVGFDFIMNDDGEIFVLECNPRATSGLHMMRDLDIPAAFLGTESFQESSRQRPTMLGPIVVMYALPNAIRERRLGELWSDLRTAKDVLFEWSDPLPSILSPISLVEVCWRSMRTRQPLTRASTFDIEWNGEPI
jgi:ATP-grasp domain